MRLQIPKWIREDKHPDDGKKYTLAEDFVYHDPRYKKSITLYRGMRSDGSTGGVDLYSGYWGVHDAICNRGKWDDGSRISNWQASKIASYILRKEYATNETRYWLEWRFLRGPYVFWATFLGGGGEARKNGMFKVDDNDDLPPGVSPV